MNRRYVRAVAMIKRQTRLSRSPGRAAFAQARKFGVERVGCRHGTRQEGVGSARSVGVGFTIPRHLGARRVLQEPVDISRS